MEFLVVPFEIRERVLVIKTDSPINDYEINYIKAVNNQRSFTELVIGGDFGVINIGEDGWNKIKEIRNLIASLEDLENITIEVKQLNDIAPSFKQLRKLIKLTIICEKLNEEVPFCFPSSLKELKIIELYGSINTQQSIYNIKHGLSHPTNFEYLGRSPIRAKYLKGLPDNCKIIINGREIIDRNQDQKLVIHWQDYYYGRGNNVVQQKGPIIGRQR